MSDKNNTKKGGKRSAARLAAVQGLYEIAVTGCDLNTALDDFLSSRWRDRLVDLGDRDLDDLDPIADPDPEMVTALMRLVTEQGRDLDARIDPVLKEGQSVERLELLIRCMLRAGLAELMAYPETDRAVIVNEYVEIARAFYGGPEVGLVNAVLDRLAGEVTTQLPLQGSA